MARIKKLVHDGFGYHITRKGYARFNCEGPRKGEYVHRYEAAKKLGRPLKQDEEVHHENTRKLDNSHSNLAIKGNREHGWISAKQAFWMRVLDVAAEKDFYAAVEQLEKEGVRIDL